MLFHFILNSAFIHFNRSGKSAICVHSSFKSSSQTRKRYVNSVYIDVMVSLGCYLYHLKSWTVGQTIVLLLEYECKLWNVNCKLSFNQINLKCNLRNKPSLLQPYRMTICLLLHKINKNKLNQNWTSSILRISYLQNL